MTLQMPEAFCGTNSGYQRHQRLDEQPCDECKRAHARYRRTLRAGGGLV